MSSSRVFFKKSVEQLDGMRIGITEQDSRFSNGVWMGVKFHQDKGMWYTSAFDLNDTVPEELLEHMSHVTVHDNFTRGIGIPDREAGVYREEEFGNSQAEFEKNLSTMCIDIRADKMENAKKIYEGNLNKLVQG